MSRDSSSSIESEVSTTASAGTWSPRLSTTTSPSTRVSIGTSDSLPSRTTDTGARSSREIRSSSSFALYSCTKPIMTFATTANKNSKSAQRWYRITTSPHSPSTRLNTVNRCARIILHRVREDLLFCVFTFPAATARSTSAVLSPQDASSAEPLWASAEYSGTKPAVAESAVDVLCGLELMNQYSPSKASGPLPTRSQAAKLIFQSIGSMGIKGNPAPCVFPENTREVGYIPYAE